MEREQFKCPECKRDAVSVGEHISPETGIKMIALRCNHNLVYQPLPKADYWSITSSDGKKLKPYQVRTCEFLEENFGRGLANLEMRLGKTPVAISMLTLHPEEMLPAAFFVKSALKEQFFKEIMRWSNGTLIPQIIEGGSDMPMMDYFKVFIISIDTAKSLDWLQNPEIGGKFRTAILDEVQRIKNPESKRAKALLNFAVSKPYVIALSGSPIENNSAEYWSTLYALKPWEFPYYERFVRDWVDTYSMWNGRQYIKKLGAIKPYRMPEFKGKLKDTVIRFTRDEVMPELPQTEITHQFCDFEEVKDKIAYIRAFDEFQEAYDGDSPFKYDAAREGSILGFLNKMRHIVGRVKVPMIVDFVSDFLIEQGKEKITIFTHHVDVRQMLVEKLTAVTAEGGFNPPLEMGGAADAHVIPLFLDDPANRILVASAKAAGEGFTLYPCIRGIIAEQHWNPMIEKQCMDRFPHMDAVGVADKFEIMYPTVIGSIDEMLLEIKARKLENVEKTLALEGEEGDVENWEETSIMKAVADRLAQKGRPKWRV